jgi:hypothetical protein
MPFKQLIYIIIIIIIIIITAFELSLGGSSLVQTKQIRLNIHKRNNTKKTVQTIQNTVNTIIYITKAPTHYKTHTHTHTHTYGTCCKIWSQFLSKIFQCRTTNMGYRNIFNL